MHVQQAQGVATARQQRPLPVDGQDRSGGTGALLHTRPPDLDQVGWGVSDVKHGAGPGIEGADISCERTSPLCGDRIRIYIKLGNDLTGVDDARFTGDGCIISQAAVSMLLEDIQGKPLAEIESLPPQHVLDLIGVPLTAQRVKCALLGLQAVKDGIKEWKAQAGR